MIPPTSQERLDDVDPLDSRLRQVHAAPGPPTSRWRLRSRLALGLSPTPRSGLILLPLGMALGPHGLNLLTRSLVSFLDPVVSVTLAALGVLVGLGVNARQPREALLLGASSLEATLTIGVVGTGVWIVSSVWQTPGLEPWVFALLLGICAATSSTAADESAGQPPSLVARIGDLDDVLPIVAGGLALALIREGSLSSSAWVTVTFLVIALIIALAGWLLVGQTASESEQHVFAAGTLLLLGGATAYLSLSALFAGLLAGMFWNVAGGPARDRISRDMRYMQHPLIVLLLLAAGARFDFAAGAVTLGAVYLACRTVGKLAGGWLARRVVDRNSPHDLGISLLSPGVTGVAFALNALQTRGEPAWAHAFLAIVVTGSIGSELLSLLVRTREARG